MEEQKSTLERLQAGEPMKWELPIGAGDALESVGRFMVVISLIAGIGAVFAFGKVASFDGGGMYGRGISTSWSFANVAIIAASTAWSAGLSFGVLRLGTALRWLEAIGTKHEITKG